MAALIQKVGTAVVTRVCFFFRSWKTAVLSFRRIFQTWLLATDTLISKPSYPLLPPFIHIHTLFFCLLYFRQ
jgi:hypothetical protein